MGLDWMLKSSDVMARKPADLDHVHEEVVKEEVCLCICPCVLYVFSSVPSSIFTFE